MTARQELINKLMKTDMLKGIDPDRDLWSAGRDTMPPSGSVGFVYNQDDSLDRNAELYWALTREFGIKNHLTLGDASVPAPILLVPEVSPFLEALIEGEDMEVMNLSVRPKIPVQEISLEMVDDFTEAVDGAWATLAAHDGSAVVSCSYFLKEAKYRPDGKPVYVFNIHRLAAIDDAAGAELLKRIMKRAYDADGIPALDDDNAHTVDFHWSTSNGPMSLPRQIKTNTFAEIEANYPAGTREKLAVLMDSEPSPSGQLTLMYGPPGTGKTTAIRALINEWKGEKRLRRVLYPLDANVFFQDSASIIDLIMSESHAGGWRMVENAGPSEGHLMIVLEDASQLVEEKGRVAQPSLAKLLNLCDGMLGQGLGIHFVISTNVDITKLHPAVVRDGRCLANIEFPEFTAEEANQWLGDHEVSEKVSEDTSLAKLYSMLSDTTVIEHKSEDGDGYRPGIYI